jgi:hypothetical protein
MIAGQASSGACSEIQRELRGLRHEARMPSNRQVPRNGPCGLITR